MFSTVPVALRNNRGRARAARLVFLLLALISAALLTIALLAPPQTGSADSMSTSTALLYAALGLVSLLYLGLLIGSYVVLILWLRRAYYNLHQLPGIYPEYSDGWAAGAWFVPFINLARPYTIMREVWNDTQRAAVGQAAEPATILGWWWAIFIFKFIIGRITWAMTKGSSDDFTQQDLTAIALDAAVQVLAAGFTWHIIGRMARFEEQLTLSQQLAQLGQPAPTPELPVVEQSDYGDPEGY